MFFRPQKESSQPIFLPSTVQNFENLKTFFELLYMINFNTHASDPSPPNQFTHKIKQRGKNPCKFCSKIWKGAVSIAKKESIPKFDQIFFCCSVHPNLILGKLTLGGFLSSSLLQLGTFAGFSFFNSIFHQEPRTSPLSHTIMSGSFGITFLLPFITVFTVIWYVRL